MHIEIVVATIRSTHDINNKPSRYAESEGSNFDDEDDSDAEAPRKHYSFRLTNSWYSLLTRCSS
jgi:hypothetical protein